MVLPMPNSKGAEPQELEVPSVSAMCPAAKLVQDQALLATQPPGQPPDSHDSDTGCLRCAPRPRPRASTTPVRLRRHLVSHTLVSYRVPTIWQPVHTEGEQQMVQHPSARASPPLPPPPPLPHPMLLLPSLFSLFLQSMSMILLVVLPRCECQRGGGGSVCGLVA